MRVGILTHHGSRCESHPCNHRPYPDNPVFSVHVRSFFMGCAAIRQHRFVQTNIYRFICEASIRPSIMACIISIFFSII
jgi:hypothetical protein